MTPPARPRPRPGPPLPERPAVTVIVPVYNGAAELRLLLPALAAQTYPAELTQVLVVDNASTDRPEEAFRDFPRFRLLREPTPGSYAARNRALQEATGEVLAFTDADCIPEPDWLEKGVAALRSTGASLVAGAIRVFPRPGRRASWVERYEMLHAFPQERFAREDHFGATANVFTTRHVMDEVGPFDARLKSGGDRQWGQRVHAAGLAVVFSPDPVVRHPARRDLDEMAKKIRRVVGGIEDQRGKAVPLTPRMVPGHLVHVARKVRGRIPVHRAKGASRGDALRVAAVEWRLEWIRMRELLRLRKGGQAQR